MAALIAFSCCCTPAASATPKESRAIERTVQQTIPGFDLDKVLLKPEFLAALAVAGIALIVAWVIVAIGLWRSKRYGLVGLIVLNAPPIALGIWLHQWSGLLIVGLQVLYAICRLLGWIGPKV